MKTMVNSTRENYFMALLSAVKLSKVALMRDIQRQMACLVQVRLIWYSKDKARI